MEHSSPLSVPQVFLGSLWRHLSVKLHKQFLFLSIAFLALVGWIVVQTFFSFYMYKQPLLVLSIEFVWWFGLLSVLVLLFHRMLKNMESLINTMKSIEQRLDRANDQIVQKNALLKVVAKDLWKSQKRFTQPAHMVAPGHYRVLDFLDDYQDVHVYTNSGGAHVLSCNCLLYQKEHICSHTIAAASLHLSVCSHQKLQRQNIV